MKTEEIKRIPIKDVMDMLGVSYSSAGTNEYTIVEGGKVTSGWRFNTEKNICYDFSKDRPSGDTFWFVKLYSWLEDKEVFDWFASKFGTSSEIKSVYSVWQILPTLTDNQVEYLKSRAITYDKVKDIVRNYNWWIGCLVYENSVAKGLNARTLSKDHDKRFMALSWYPTKWIYEYRIDKEKDYIIVVEWLIDFLSLRQYDTNVVWLKSAESGIDEIIRLAKDYKIIFCFDNDEAGKKTIDKLKGIKVSLFDVSDFIDGAKDVNDVMVTMWEDADLVIDFIVKESKEVSPIDSTFEKLLKVQETIKERWKLWYDWPQELQQLYDLTSGVIPWMVYAIGAFSNTGKSKLACFHVWRFLKMWKKVCVISLEVSEWKYLMDIIQSHDYKTQQEMIAGYKAKQSDYKNLIIRDDLWTLKSITEYVKSIDSDIVIIDFVQNIQEKGSIYERNANIAQWIQKLASETQKTIYSISQIDNASAGDINRTWSVWVPKLKGAGEYVASSDVVMILYNDDGVYKLRLAKNKFWPNNVDFLLEKNLNIWYFSIIWKENPR